MSDVSDHFSILTKIPHINKPNEKNKIYYRRSKLSSNEWMQFNSELKSILNEKIAHNTNRVSNDPNFCANCLTNAYLFLIEKFISRKQRRFFNKPWITKGIKVSIKTKNKMFKLSKSSSEPTVLEKYKAYRNLLSRLKFRAKNNYYADLAVQYGNDKSKIWRLVKEITKKKRNTNNSIKSINDKNGLKLQHPKLIANSLNEHFSTIGEKMASTLEKGSNPQKDPLDYITTDVKGHFVPSLTSTSEILKLI